MKPQAIIFNPIFTNEFGEELLPSARCIILQTLIDSGNYGLPMPFPGPFHVKGTVYRHPILKDGTEVITSAVQTAHSTREVETLNTLYSLVFPF